MSIHARSIQTRLATRARRLGVVAGLAALASTALIATAGPAMASTGESDVAVSTLQGLFVAVQPDGAPPSDWTIEEAATDSPYSWSSPSIYRQSTGGIVMTAVRGDGSLWFFWQGPGATNWNPQEVAGPDSAYFYDQPSIASQTPLEPGDQTETMIVAQDENDTNAHYYTQVNGGTGWASGTLPTATGVELQPDVSVAPDDTFLVSADGTSETDVQETYIQIDRLPYNSSTWSTLVYSPSTPQLQDTSIIEQPGGGEIIAAADYSGNTYFFWSASGTSGWHQETVGTSNNNGPSYSSYIQPMSLTGTDTGVAIGAENSADTCNLVFDQADGAVGWTKQTVGCTPYPVPEALALDPGSHNEAAASLEGRGDVYFYWQGYGTTTWNKETIPNLGNVSSYTNPSLAVE
jgi:hypothetical protein